jgi:hypothetical protein
VDSGSEFVIQKELFLIQLKLGDFKMHAKYENDNILIFEGFKHKESIKQISGRIWDASLKVWIVPFSQESLMLLHMLDCKLDETLQQKMKEIQNTDGIRDPSMGPQEPMPIKVSAYQHQVQAYQKACSMMGIFERG